MNRIIKFIFCILILNSNPVFSQNNWPDKPVKILVPSTPGSQTDIGARIVAERLSKKFSQSFVIENRPGANGKIANVLIKQSQNDGYTLLFTYAAAQVVTPLVYSNSPDPIKDFSPIVQLGSGGNVLLVPADMPVNNLKEFINYVKSKPENELSYASWGIGSGGHLCMEFIKAQSGLEIKHVPYKSTVESNTALMSGQVQAAFTGAFAANTLIQSGKVKAIAISGLDRYSLLPEVKTMTEQGIPLNVTTWFGLFAPAGTSPAIINLINAEINKMIKDPTMADKIKTTGVSTSIQNTPEHFASIVAQDLKQFEYVVKKINLKME